MSTYDNKSKAKDNKKDIINKLIEFENNTTTERFNSLQQSIFFTSSFKTQFHNSDQVLNNDLSSTGIKTNSLSRQCCNLDLLFENELKEIRYHADLSGALDTFGDYINDFKSL